MLKKTLLMLGVMSLATSAMAVESTNPFYVPAEGGILSTTSYDYSTRTLKHDYAGIRAKVYSHTATQTLEYGLSNAWSLGVTASNSWAKGTINGTISDYDYDYEVRGTDKKDKNINFEITSKYNLVSDGALKVQSLLAYGQEENHSYYGFFDDLDNEQSGAYKYAKVGAKVGYKLGYWTPYLAGTVEVPVFQSQDDDNELKYTGTAGLYSYCPKMKVSMDHQLGVEYDEYDETRLYTYGLEAAYHFTKNVALSAYGKYIIDGEEHKEDIHGNQIGLRLRLGF
ncbi:MAG: hypothetical protein J6V53_03815 [Alphaproteobacteria bacterium]|nr:hypothetical protein [Alphaproteobacteria bacterium]